MRGRGTDDGPSTLDVFIGLRLRAPLALDGAALYPLARGAGAVGARMTKPKAAPTTLAALTADPQNRRAHGEANLAMIATALKEVGAARSIVIDETSTILAGNGVVQAAQQAGLTKLRIVEADGDEIIAVRRRGLTAAQKRALALFDNRTGELATWNLDQLLADQAAGLDLASFWSDAELSALLNGNGGPKAGRTDPDAVPEVRSTDIQRGDLFELGAHRLLCGDATDATDVARVMGEDKPFLMVTDPPYGVEYDPDWRNKATRPDGTPYGARSLGQVNNDGRIDWTPAWQLFTGGVAYVWHASLFGGEVGAGLAHAGFQLRSQIIWAKTHFAISRGHYHWQHETCFYAVRDSSSAKWAGDHKQTTLWKIDPLQSYNSEEIHTSHSTQKPVECMLRPLRNHEALQVYDPFAGSGTTLIAAESLGRACRALEIEPQYVQVALDRWEQFTGQTAQKVGEAVRETRQSVTPHGAQTLTPPPQGRRRRHR